MKTAQPWTDEALDLLKREFLRGSSFRMIMRVMNTALGTRFSRNALIGKAHRLGLMREKATASAVEEKRPRHGNAPRSKKTQAIPSIEPVIPEAPADPRFASHDGLHPEIPPHGCCKWIVGDVMEKDYFFCGNPALPDKPYCARHHARAFESVWKRRRRLALEQAA